VNPVLLAWLQFAVCAALIGAAGYRLSLYGDVIAEKTGLGRNSVGLFLLVIYLFNSYVIFLHGE
jgi:cation:H+ antiporter